MGTDSRLRRKQIRMQRQRSIPRIEQIEHQEMTYGRFINDVDIREARKVCVIGKRVYESLFKPGEDPCGKYIRVNGIYYRVIGSALPRAM